MDYRSINAINASFLKACLKSPLDGWNYLKNPPKASEAMELGTAIHCAILEPEKFQKEYLLIEDCDRRTTAGKKYYEEKKRHAEEYGLKLVDQHDLTRCVDAFYQSKPCRSLLEETEKEKIIVWDNGEPKKALIDIYHETMIADLKTTSADSIQKFIYDFYDLNYDVQMLHYADAAGFNVDEHKILMAVIETKSAQAYVIDVTKAVFDERTQEKYNKALDAARSVLKLEREPRKYKDEIYHL